MTEPTADLITKPLDLLIERRFCWGGNWSLRRERRPLSRRLGCADSSCGVVLGGVLRPTKCPTATGSAFFRTRPCRLLQSGTYNSETLADLTVVAIPRATVTPERVWRVAPGINSFARI